MSTGQLTNPHKQLGNMPYQHLGASCISNMLRGQDAGSYAMSQPGHAKEGGWAGGSVHLMLGLGDT